MDLVIVGSVGLDDVETPFGKVTFAPGGSATFACLTAAFYAKTGFVGVVGDDWPEAVNDTLRSRGVNLDGLERKEGKTFRWSGKYGFDLNSRDTLFTDLNVFADFDPVLPAAYRDVKFLFLGNIQPTLQWSVLEQAKGAQFVGLDTMNLWIEHTPDDLKKVLGRVNALLINDSEARELSGESNIVKAARAVSAMGPELVIIKRGEYGALVYKEGEFFFVPAYPLESVVDPTGAGDCFAGGFMGYLAREGKTDWGTLCQAMVAGSALASFCVEDFSIRRLQELDSAALEARIQQFRSLTHFGPLTPLG